MRTILLPILAGLLLLAGCTNFSSASPAPIAGIAASEQQTPQQVVDGFDDYQFPEPEPTAEEVVATGQVVGESGEVAVGRVSQAALGGANGLATEVVSNVPVVTGLADANSIAAPLAASSEGTSYRPIPTASAEEAVSVAVLAAQQAASGARQPLVSLDRDAFVYQLRSYRDALREVVYMTDMAFANGSLDCGAMQMYVATMDAVPRQVDVPLDLQLANYHLQIAFDQVETAFRPIFNYCAGVNGVINIAAVEPANIVTDIFPLGQTALQNVYEAVLWVMGDSVKMRELYFTTRNKVADYRNKLSNEAVSCAELSASYESIVYSPMLSLPESQIANTYQHYRAAINIVTQQASGLYSSCSNSGSVDMATRTAVANALMDSITQLDIAITYLP